ncbi:hypothetical protein RHGRI_022845 [Rhododendron griersonianum]|uniref:Uncharacterized protein n=1 Tax=Rhododendron griersonianum TaxID=479676 RepID=A0AAV6J5N8_9ERIC|nr:hypothetical protein RHGRI_022845 [Rhododendron griersonianum]
MDGIHCRFPFCSSSAAVSLVSNRWLCLHRSSKICIFLRLSPDNCKPPSLSSFLLDPLNYQEYHTVTVGKLF